MRGWRCLDACVVDLVLCLLLCVLVFNFDSMRPFYRCCVLLVSCVFFFLSNKLYVVLLNFFRGLCELLVFGWSNARVLVGRFR